MKTRVLIIGAGGAGLCAALAAAESGAEVTVVSKTPAGTSTSTAFSGGVFTLASGDVTPDMHFERTMKIGGMVNNPRLVRVLADNAEKSLKKGLPSLGASNATLDGIPLLNIWKNLSRIEL